MSIEQFDLGGSVMGPMNMLAQVRLQQAYRNALEDRQGLPAETYNALEAHGGPTRAAGAALDAGDWLTYTNQGATRNQPLSADLIADMAFLADMGIGMEVFSGGQPSSGPNRVGSHRHDHGGAADVFFTKDGRRLDWANEGDIPIYQEIVRRAKANGLTGFGAGVGYMQPGSMHIGYGAPAVWGEGGRGVNAPDWLREAYSG